MFPIDIFKFYKNQKWWDKINCFTFELDGHITYGYVLREKASRSNARKCNSIYWFLFEHTHLHDFVFELRAFMKLSVLWAHWNTFLLCFVVFAMCFYLFLINWSCCMKSERYAENDWKKKHTRKLTLIKWKGWRGSMDFLCLEGIKRPKTQLLFRFLTPCQFNSNCIENR